MSEKYEAVDGKMPAEFHKKHLLNEFARSITIQCANCNGDESVTDDAGEGFQEHEETLEEFAAGTFYEAGWRYCELPDYAVEGIFCAGCVRDEEGIENNALQQPQERKEIDD